MKPKASVLALIGAASLAVATSVTYAVVQSSRSPFSQTQSSQAQSSQVESSQTQSSQVTEALTTGQVSPKASAEATAVSPPQVTEVAEKQPAQPSTPASPAAPAVSRKLELCTLRMAIVRDPQPPLNVRSSPSTTATNVVGQLKNDTFVTVVDEENGWLQITTPIKGWISKQRTENGCNQKVERINLGGSSNMVSISDRFIGTGNHRYVLSLSQGQTMTITRDRGPFPSLIAPNGTYLVEGPLDEKRERWTGKLSEPGNYTLELDSNFRGYRYAFLVEVN